MTDYVPVAVYLFALIIYVSGRDKLTILDAAYFYLSVQFVAVLRNCFASGTEVYPALVFSFGLLFFSIGTFVVARYSAVPRGGLGQVRPSIGSAHLKIFAAFIALGVVFHYLVVGIPLFSDSITTARFEQAGSGVFGIPSRIAIYGPTFLLFLTSSYLIAFDPQDSKIRRAFWFCVIFCAVTQVFSGNKGSVLVLIQIILVCLSVFSSRNIRIVKRSHMLASVVGAILVVFWVGSLQIQGMDSSPELAHLMFDRIFLVSGWPFYTVITSFVPSYGLGYGLYFIQDVMYVFSLVGFDFQVDSATRQVSAYMHGRDPRYDFIVPVTITAFGQFYLDFGLTGVILGSITYGATFKWFVVAAQSSKGTVYSAVLMFHQLVLFVGATKGNVLYAMASAWFALLVFLLFLAFLRLLETKTFTSRF